MTRVLLALALAATAIFGAIRIYRSVNGSEHSERKGPARYRCPMHPSYLADRPGTCPLCGMKLTEITAGKADRNTVAISEAESKSAGITTARVQRLSLSQSVPAVGEIILDSPASLAAPVAGRIQQILLKLDGPNAVAAKEGQPILKLLPKSAGAETPHSLDVRAPVLSWVTITAREGTEVEAGAPLAYYSGFRTLPVIADVALESAALVEVGSPADMTADAAPGEHWSGVVTNLLGAAGEEKPRSVKVKLEFRNQSTNVRTNTAVHLSIRHVGNAVLAVPDDAVLWSGTRWICYVPSGAGRYTARPVQVGQHYPGFYEVRSGLRVGDVVVSRAAFLVDSESRLQAEIEN